MNSNSFIFIDSGDRVKGSTNDFTVSLKDHHIGLDKDVAIHNLIIPYSYYAINSNNNDFLCGPTGSDTITLTDGNYTGSQLATELATQLNVVLSPTYTVVFDDKTGKFTYSTGDSSEFSLITDTKNNRYLGFTKSSTNASSSGSLTSANVVDLAGTKFVEIRSNLHLHSENTSNDNHDILTRVYPNSDAFSSIFYDSSSFSNIYYDGHFLNKLDLSLFDDNGDALLLNGLEWSMTLKTTLRATTETVGQRPSERFELSNLNFRT